MEFKKLSILALCAFGVVTNVSAFDAADDVEGFRHDPQQAVRRGVEQEQKEEEDKLADAAKQEELDKAFVSGFAKYFDDAVVMHVEGGAEGSNLTVEDFKSDFSADPAHYLKRFKEKANNIIHIVSESSEEPMIPSWDNSIGREISLKWFIWYLSCCNIGVIRPVKDCSSLNIEKSDDIISISYVKSFFKRADDGGTRVVQSPVFFVKIKVSDALFEALGKDEGEYIIKGTESFLSYVSPNDTSRRQEDQREGTLRNRRLAAAGVAAVVAVSAGMRYVQPGRAEGGRRLREDVATVVNAFSLLKDYCSSYWTS